MSRLKKIKIIQLLLLILGLLVFYFTYYGSTTYKKSIGLSEKTKNEIIRKTSRDASENTRNIFYNIKYNGIDFSGNRYVLTSKEAATKKDNENLLDLIGVNYIFYFKDGTTLEVISSSGLYNSETLDMKFKEKVLMKYNGNILEAESAEYSNSGNYLKIQDNVKIKSELGNMMADEFFFDLNTKKLKINSFNDNNIKANIKIDEKRF